MKKQCIEIIHFAFITAFLSCKNENNPPFESLNNQKDESLSNACLCYILNDENEVVLVK